MIHLFHLPKWRVIGASNVTYEYGTFFGDKLQGRYTAVALQCSHCGRIKSRQIEGASLAEQILEATSTGGKRG